MKNINEIELKNYIFKKLQESYFDELEFDDVAIKAAMQDIESSGEEFEELGTSKFEKDPKFKEKFKSSLNRANLELPSDEAEVARLAKMVNDRNAHEKRFGKGSLNESDMTQEAYEASRYMFFGNLEQIRRQAGLLLDLDEDKINEILENGHDWAQDHIATAKESIDQVFDFLMNETQSGDMWKSVDVEYKKDEEEIEEGMGHSFTVGMNKNEKPVNYPEDLMREAVKNTLDEVFGKFTSTSSNTRGGGFTKATLQKKYSTMAQWIQKKYPNITVKSEMPSTTKKSGEDAGKPTIYMWIPTNNSNAIQFKYENVANAMAEAKKHIAEISKAYPGFEYLDPIKKGKDDSQATLSITQASAQPAAATNKTAKPALAENFMKEDEHFKLSLLDKIKIKLAGVSEDQAIENLNNGFPIDWNGSKEGFYDSQEPRGDYSGTNEGLEEDMDKTDYSFNKAGLDYEAEEEARNELGDELYYVLDDEFNNANYPDLVGKTFPEKPTDDVNVKILGDEEEIEESSSDSLANKHGKNAKPNAYYLKEGVDNNRYEQVIFLQDHESNHALNILKQDGVDEAMDYLMQWHQPGNHETSEETGFGSSDKTYERNGYIMAWNPSLGYISLVHDLNSSIDEDSQRKRHTAGQIEKVAKNVPLGKNAPHSDSAIGL